MTTLLLAGSLFFSALPGALTPTQSDDMKVYEAARVQAGRDPEAHVKLALWCESHGLDALREKHLALAVLIEPSHAKARGLLGLVPYRGRWENPERVGTRIKADEALSKKLAEYNARREQLLGRLTSGRNVSKADAARAHVKLGMWCEQNGLAAEATAHFTSAVVLDPYRDATWKHLGYVKHDGRWMTPEQIESSKRDAELQREADKSWTPLLKSWRSRVARDSNDDEAQRLLSEVRDPRAVPAILRVFRDGSESDQGLAVRLLGQINVAASTRALASLAIRGVSGLVRAAATAALRERERRDYAGLLVEMIRGPMRYQAQPVGGPGAPGALLVETTRFRMLRTYDAPPLVAPTAGFFGYIGYDGNGLPVVLKGREILAAERNTTTQPETLARGHARAAELIALANLKAVDSQQRLIADVEQIEMANAEVAQANSRVIPVLQEALDAPDLGNDEDAWHTWWYDQLGYRYEPPPQVTVTVSASPQYPPPSITSCFAAGTPVRTLEGHRPIETLQVGDHVLTQDVSTGALSFQAIQVVHHNPPAKTVRVELDRGETLTASIYHRFWRAGRGWAMARELEAGHVLRTREGRARIVSVSPGPEVPVYNLDVAATRTFFVGANDALVHDNRLPEPIRPFDAEPVLEATRTVQR